MKAGMKNKAMTSKGSGPKSGKTGKMAGPGVMAKVRPVSGAKMTRKASA